AMFSRLCLKFRQDPTGISVVLNIRIGSDRRRGYIRREWEIVITAPGDSVPLLPLRRVTGGAGGR
ncbi:MAG: hypothetical protein MK335_08250, partial [Gemmatimonadetes bacterium]|nr:hypothetical protein [Gemmatimonadota bacterium]